MAKNKNDKPAQQPDPTNSEEPTPNSSPLDEAQANENAATQDSSDNTNTDEQESQPRPAEEDATKSPTTEAELTHSQGDLTTPVPAGSADATADASADGQHNDTVNSHPQSALHRGELSKQDQADILEASQQPGAVIAAIADKYGVTPERILEVIDDGNQVPAEERNV